MSDRIADIWGTRTPHAAGTPWPVRVDRYVVDGVTEPDITGAVGVRTPAVSLPDLSRIQAILAQQRLFVVVSDALAYAGGVLRRGSHGYPA